MLHSQAFSTSQCLIPFLAVPALFRAGSASGIFDPAELSPPEDRVAFRFPIPSCRYNQLEHHDRNRNGFPLPESDKNRFLVSRQPVSNWQFAYTELIPSAVRSYDARYYPYSAADALLGLAPSKVFSLFASEDVFASSSSYVGGEEPFRRKFLPCTIEY